MPRLPTSADYGVSTPRPSRDITAVQPTGFGAALAGIGGELAQKFAEEKKKLDALAAQDALNELENARLRMTYDPADGFINVQGKDVLSKPLLKDVPDAFKVKIEGISARLKTPEQRAAFKTASSGVELSLRRDLFRHVAMETDKAHSQIAKDTLLLGQQKVDHDPAALEAAIQDSHKTLAAEFDRLKVPDATRELSVKSTDADLVRRALKGLMSGDTPDLGSAEALVKRYEDVLDKTVVEGFRKDLAEQSRDAVAADLAGNLYDAYARGSMPVTEVSAALAQYAGEDRKLKEQAQQLFTERVHFLNIQRDETKGELVNRLYSASGPISAVKNEIMASESFKALDGERRAAIVNLADNEARQRVMQSRSDTQWKWSQQDHAESQRNRAEDRRNKKWFDDPEVVTKYLDAINDPDLGARRPGYGVGLADKIGKELAFKVESERARQAAGAKHSKFDQAILQDAIPKELLGKGKADDRNAFTAQAHVGLSDWKEAHPGKIPELADQQEILRGVLKEYTVPRDYWFDKQVPAYKLKPMPNDFKQQATSVFLKTKKRQPTLDELNTIWAAQPGSQR